jgi:hypothetical protein
MLVIEFVLSQVSGIAINIYWLLGDFAQYNSNGQSDMSASHWSVYKHASYNAEAIGKRSEATIIYTAAPCLLVTSSSRHPLPRT